MDESNRLLNTELVWYVKVGASYQSFGKYPQMIDSSIAFIKKY
jgi:hypothetical protein